MKDAGYLTGRASPLIPVDTRTPDMLMAAGLLALSFAAAALLYMSPYRLLGLLAWGWFSHFMFRWNSLFTLQALSWRLL